MTQTILIAGASRGIGLEMAKQAKARGDKVIVMVRSAESAKAVESIAAQVLMASVTDEAALAQAAAALSDDIDLLVCNGAAPANPVIPIGDSFHVAGTEVKHRRTGSLCAAGGAATAV